MKRIELIDNAWWYGTLVEKLTEYIFQCANIRLLKCSGVYFVSGHNYVPGHNARPVFEHFVNFVKRKNPEFYLYSNSSTEFAVFINHYKEKTLMVPKRTYKIHWHFFVAKTSRIIHGRASVRSGLQNVCICETNINDVPIIIRFSSVLTVHLSCLLFSSSSSLCLFSFCYIYLVYYNSNSIK